MDVILNFLSRPANVAYNWLVIAIEEELWMVDLRPMLYEKPWKPASFFGMLLATDFGLKDVLVELLKRHTRPAEVARGQEITFLACHAAQYDNTEIVRLLLKHENVDWSVCGFNHQTLLMLIAQWNDEDTLRTLLQKESCSVNATTCASSALHEAVHSKSTSVTRILLEAGADVGARTIFGKTALGEAIEGLIYGPKQLKLPIYSWAEMMDLLLEYKADINTHWSFSGDTALHHVAKTSAFGTYPVEYLVSNGANLNLPNARGDTPLDLAEEENNKISTYDKEAAAKNVEIIREAGGKTAGELFQPAELRARRAGFDAHYGEGPRQANDKSGYLIPLISISIATKSPLLQHPANASARNSTGEQDPHINPQAGQFYIPSDNAVIRNPFSD